jgi:hypothetical protein
VLLRLARFSVKAVLTDRTGGTFTVKIHDGDHPAPHIHVEQAGQEWLVEIESRKVTGRGKMLTKIRKPLQMYLDKNQDELVADFWLVQQGGSPVLPRQ